MSALGPKVLAMAALVGIQVMIGCVFKLSQHHGKYEYSTAGAQAISEIIKFFMSASLFLKSQVDGTDPVLPSTGEWADPNRWQSPAMRKAARGAAMVWSTATTLPMGVVYGMSLLALLYAFNNQLIFVVFTWADPGTINLVKAGATLISALMLWGGLGRVVTSTQWLAIILQMCGMIVSQFEPCSTSGAGKYSLGVYGALAGSVAVSAFCGVVNDHLAKSYKVSLYAQNLVMYGVGSALNLALYLFRVVSTGGQEPGFFSGYTPMACLVVFCNAVIGLVITAVYKYADAIIKTLASSFSTAILLFLGPVLFGAKSLSFVSQMGCVVVFIATYLYMTGGPPKSAAPTKAHAKEEAEPLQPKASAHLGKKDMPPPMTARRGWFTPLTCLLVLVVAAGAFIFNSSGPATLAPGPVVKDEPLPQQEESQPVRFANVTDKISLDRASPLFQSVAVIRVPNKDIQRSVALLGAYTKFFKAIIMQTQGFNGVLPNVQVHSCHSSVPYQCLLEILPGIQEKYGDDYNGIVTFPIDVWLRPQEFVGLNKELLWQSDPPMYGTLSRCTLPQHYEDFRTRTGSPMLAKWAKFPEPVTRALKAVCDLPGSPFGCPQYLCMDQPKLLYVPRGAAVDSWSDVARTFAREDVPQLIAVPTLMEVITERHDQPELVHCPSPPKAGTTIADLRAFRCGAGLEPENADLVSWHIKALAEFADAIKL